MLPVIEVLLLLQLFQKFEPLPHQFCLFLRNLNQFDELSLPLEDRQEVLLLVLDQLKLPAALALSDELDVAEEFLEGNAHGPLERERAGDDVVERGDLLFSDVL